MLLEKYTSRKTSNVFSRFVGVKRYRSPSGLGGYQQWKRNSYDQEPYFAMQPAYWGGAPPMYPQFPPWGYNPWVPYPTGPTCYFQPEWISSRPMFRPNSRGRSRARFNQRAIPRDDNVIFGSDERPVSGTSDTRGRYNADGIIHIGGQKFKWMPINRESHAKIRDGVERGCTKSSAAKDTNIQAYSEPDVHTRFGKAVVRTSASEIADTAENNSEGTYVDAVRCGLVQRKDSGTQEDSLVNILVTSSSTSQKLDSGSTRTYSILNMSNLGTSTSVSAMGFRPGFSMSTQHGNPRSSQGQKVAAGGVSDQQKSISANDKIFFPGTTVRRYRPRDLGGSGIKSVAPGTKPGPRWCPTGLTPTQKR